MIPVTFTCRLPIPGSITLQLQGVRNPLTLELHGEVWIAVVELPPGAYAYRFVVDNSVVINDCRGTTQQEIDQEIWSVVHVTDQDGPIWVERPMPKLVAIATCQGISDRMLPLVALDQVRFQDLPFILWTQVNHLYNDAHLQVFLLRPDGELAFGGEFVLESSKAEDDFSLKFWLSIDLEPEHAIPGEWIFLVQAEGSPLVQKRIDVLPG